MRFRTGLLIGLAVGYYYGAKAGRERFVQIDAWLDTIRSTTTYQDARIKVSDGLREGTTAARRAFESGIARDDAHDDADASFRSMFSDPTLN
jgi:hypothetical protein